MTPYVLVVDDSADVRHLVMDLLNVLHVRGYEASHGEEALAAVKEQQPSVIVLDIMMPVMNGFSVLTQLRANKESRDIPIILLSGVANNEDQMKMLPGVIGVLKKGEFSMLELRALLERALKAVGVAV
jgi:CheY-like chemotaxis protein